MKKPSWLARLVFEKHCLVPGYSKHLDFHQQQAEYNQRREDEFVEIEIERLAQEQYGNFISEKQKWDAFAETLNSHESKKLCFPIVIAILYPRCYHVSDYNSAKFVNVNINQKIQDRYEQLKQLLPILPNRN